MRMDMSQSQTKFVILDSRIGGERVVSAVKGFPMKYALILLRTIPILHLSNYKNDIKPSLSSLNLVFPLSNTRAEAVHVHPQLHDPVTVSSC